MQALSKKALEILKSTDKIKKSDQNTFDTLHAFLKKVNPNTTDPSHSLMFDICIQFFKPVHINLKKVDVHVKKRLILDILAQGDEVDTTLQDYLNRLKETDEGKKNIKDNKERTQQELEQSGMDMDTATKGLVYTENFLNNLEPGSKLAQLTLPNRSDKHNISNVTFEFSTDAIKQINKETNEEEYLFNFRWSIFDPITGKTTTGKMITDDLSQTAPKKLQVVGDHMKNRVTRVQQRQARLNSEINNLDGRYKSAIFNKEALEASNYNYKEYKKMMEARYSAEQDEKLQKMRNKLRGLQTEKLTNR